jgi:putative ABC transport system substrate-binding protein
MRRRTFIVLAASSAAQPVLTLAKAAAQPSGKLWRVGILETVSSELNAGNYNALRAGLRELGYIEGSNLEINYRSADGRTDQFPVLAAELVGLKVDVIVTRGTSAVQAAKDATSTTPIVMRRAGTLSGPASSPVLRDRART